MTVYHFIDNRTGDGLCIIIPFRDKPNDIFSQGKGRTQNLREWKQYMCTFLPKVGHSKSVVRIIEQTQDLPFNKGALFNIGAILEMDADCFIFHDVDHIPERTSNTYTCQDDPVHMVTRTSQFGYKVVHQGSVGGALSMKRSFFKKINGYSTMFWGWGGEDDNMRLRIGPHLHKLDATVGVYKALDHERVHGLDKTDLYNLHPSNDRASGTNTTIFTQMKETVERCNDLMFIHTLVAIH